MSEPVVKTEEKSSKKAVKFDLNTSLTELGNFLRRHMDLLFFLVLIAGIGYAIISSNEALNTTADTPTQDTKNSASLDYSLGFDFVTRKKISQLLDPQSNTPISLPEGRINPFSE